MHIGEVNASHYVGYTGNTISVVDFMREATDGERSYLLHIGPGFVQLQIAVQAESADAAIDTVDSWLLANKPDELDAEGIVIGPVRVQRIRL